MGHLFAGNVIKKSVLHAQRPTRALKNANCNLTPHCNNPMEADKKLSYVRSWEHALFFYATLKRMDSGTIQPPSNFRISTSEFDATRSLARLPEPMRHVCTFTQHHAPENYNDGQGHICWPSYTNTASFNSKQKQTKQPSTHTSSTPQKITKRLIRDRHSPSTPII